MTSSCQANSFTSEGRNGVLDTCEQGCIEIAITIAMTLGDLTVVNNDVGFDAEEPEHDRGRQHDRGPARCQRPQSFSDVQAGHDARGWILAIARVQAP